jgi:tRNA-specific 2-thiouridylase
VVGRHDGLASYTVGQRRGLGVAAGRPQYVVSMDVKRNVVVVGDESDLMRRELAFRVEWVDIEAARNAVASGDLRAQIRSRHDATRVESITFDNDTARVALHASQRAIAPGQTLALFDSDVVVGAGIISSSGSA